MISGDAELVLRKDGKVFSSTFYDFEARVLRHWGQKWQRIWTRVVWTTPTGIRTRGWRLVFGLRNWGCASTYRLRFETGRVLWVTPEQELMMWPHRWVRADQLDYRARLVVAATELDDESMRFDRVVEILADQAADVFELSGRFPNFLASGIVVRHHA